MSDGTKKSENLNARQRRFVAEKVKGKSSKQAALDAGYALTTAHTTTEKLMKKPAVRNEFQRLFNKALPDQKLVQCIRDGIDAKETKFFQSEGKVTDSRDVIAWGERRGFAELACRIKQVIPDKDLSHEREPVEVVIQVLGEATVLVNG